MTALVCTYFMIFISFLHSLREAAILSKLSILDCFNYCLIRMTSLFSIFILNWSSLLNDCPPILVFIHDPLLMVESSPLASL